METGLNPRDGPGASQPRAGCRFLSRRRCRWRGRLTHARIVAAFAASTSAPGRPPVTPRDVTFSPVFPTQSLPPSLPLASPLRRSRVVLGPGLAWLISMSANFVTFVANAVASRRAIAVDTLKRAGARQLTGEGASRASIAQLFRAIRRVADGHVGVLGAPVSKSQVWREPAPQVRPVPVIQNRTHFVEKYDELAKPTSVYRGVAVRHRDQNRHDGRKCRTACRLFLTQGRAFRHGTKGYGGDSGR
jgi:hypothetical protein